MRFYKPHNYQHTKFIIRVDCVDYEIRFATYESNQLYGRCMMYDPVSKNTYYVHNRIELNGHTFVFVWSDKYDWNRDNYIPDKDLTVYVDETPAIDPQAVYNQIRGNIQNIQLNVH